MADRRGQPGEPGLPGEPGVAGGGAGGRGGRGGRGASLATGWNRWRGLIGYFFLILVLIVALEYHHERDDRLIRGVQGDVCENSKTIAANQKLVLESLINLRLAALASPYLRLEAQRELVDLQAALRKLEAQEDPCALLSG